MMTERERLVDRMLKSPLANEKVLESLETSPAVKQILAAEQNSQSKKRQAWAEELVIAKASATKEESKLATDVAVAKADLDRAIKNLNDAKGKHGNAIGALASAKWRAECSIKDLQSKLANTCDPKIGRVSEALDQVWTSYCGGDRRAIQKFQSSAALWLGFGSLGNRTEAASQDVLDAIRKAQTEIAALRYQTDDVAESLAEIIRSIPNVKTQNQLALGR